MKNFIIAIVLLSLFSCNNSKTDNDFVHSKWGDKYSVVKEEYRNEKGYDATQEMISYDILSMKDTAKVKLLFSNDLFVSSSVKYNQKGDKETKKLYDAYVKKNRDKFGFETFMGNPKTYEFKVYEQRIWQDDRTLVSLRLDSNQVSIKYYDKKKMPID